MKVNRSKSLTALAALSCLLGRPVNADTTLSVGNTSGFPGSTVSIPVILQNSAGVVAAQFDLVYPASDLAAGAATAGGALAGHVVRSSKPALSSRRVVIYSLNNAAVANGILAYVPFIISSSATSGIASLTLTNVVLVNASGSRFSPVSIVAGTLSVIPTNCAYAIAPTNANFGPAGGTGAVQIATAAGCNWTNAASENWITITASATGTGNGSVSYSVSASTNPVARSGTILIAGLVFTITQGAQGPTSPLTIVIRGSGTVTPNLNRQSLRIGKSYTVTATASPGYVFSNWTGGVVSESPRLTFVMQANLLLQANFVPNPFIPAKGTYNGLFFEASGVSHESAGFFTVTSTDKGRLTLKLLLAGKHYSSSGQFGLDGRATRTILRQGLPTLTVGLRMDLTGADRLTGSVGDGVWSAELRGERAVFNVRTNPAPYVGKYTAVILGGDDSARTPGGDGYGVVNVNMAGTVRLSGKLADGQTISQGVSLSKNGEWPLYVSIYGGKGSVLSWVTFTNATESDLSGNLSWIKPSIPTAKFYPGGFTNETAASGSAYTRPASGERILNITNSQVSFTDGNLQSVIVNQVSLGTNNRVMNLSSNKLSLTFVLPTGLVRGTVVNPATLKTITFSGVVLQKQNAAAGYFLGTNQSGTVLLGP